jgi:hypothetical protein
MKTFGLLLPFIIVVTVWHEDISPVIFGVLIKFVVGIYIPYLCLIYNFHKH